jgi:hypothetical protein
MQGYQEKPHGINSKRNYVSNRERKKEGRETNKRKKEGRETNKSKKKG